MTNLINSKQIINQIKKEGINNFIKQLPADKKQQLLNLAIANNIVDHQTDEVKKMMFDCEFIIKNYEAALTPTTRKDFKPAITKYENWLKKENLDWLKVERENALSYQAYLLKNFKNNTALLNRFFIRKIYDEFLIKGVIKTNPFNQLPKIKKEWKLRNTGSYNERNLHELLAAIKNLKANRETKIAVLKSTLICANLGLRWSEVSSLEVNHKFFRWLGKGKKLQLAEVTDDLKKTLKITKTTDYFKSYWYWDKKITTKYLREKFTLASKKTAAKWSPHDLRHYFARQLFLKTNNILKVQKALGHSSISTTAIYLKEYFNFMT